MHMAVCAAYALCNHKCTERGYTREANSSGGSGGSTRSRRHLALLRREVKEHFQNPWARAFVVGRLCLRGATAQPSPPHAVDSLKAKLSPYVSCGRWHCQYAAPDSCDHKGH